MLSLDPEVPMEFLIYVHKGTLKTRTVKTNESLLIRRLETMFLNKEVDDLRDITIHLIRAEIPQKAIEVPPIVLSME